MHNCIDSSFISEQDLIGFFLIYHLGYKPKKILYLRNGIEYKLSAIKEKLSALIGFKNITYERWNLKKGIYPWYKLIKQFIINLIQFLKLNNYAELWK